jgi:magnesium-transporting ATPase (P-type)
VKVLGSPTEGALLKFAERMAIYDGRTQGRLNASNPNSYKEFVMGQLRKVHTFEFTRDRKAMSTLFTNQTDLEPQNLK